MKRVLAGLIVIICLAIICIYIFIPSQLVISKVALINANPEATTRAIVQANKWPQQFKKDTLKSSFTNNPDIFFCNDKTFQILNRRQSSLDILISAGDAKMNSSLSVLPASRDTVALQWQALINAGNNPVGRLQKYLQALGLKQSMSEVINQLTIFLKKQENIYGVSIQKTSTSDTFLVATKTILPNYPSTADIYNLVANLNAHLAKKGAVQISAPMLNVTTVGTDQYLVMVALPINMKLPDEGNIFFRRMVPGNFLLAEVKGGIYTINTAMDNMHLFITDYGKTSMAIPFQSLITDRSKEADTSKWVTRIYYPINY